RAIAFGFVAAASALLRCVPLGAPARRSGCATGATRAARGTSVPRLRPSPGSRGADPHGSWSPFGRRGKRRRWHVVVTGYCLDFVSTAGTAHGAWDRWPGSARPEGTTDPNGTDAAVTAGRADEERVCERSPTAIAVTISRTGASR